METTQTYDIGNSQELLKTIPDNFVDLICTDPPFGISFMNHKWDIDVPPTDIWKECLRVLKPGAFAFVMSSPRQDVLCEMIIRLKHAGFDTNFTSIYYVYASGFPKSMNISKAIDRRLGLERERLENPNALNQNKEVLKYGFSNEAISNEAISNEAKKFQGSFSGFQPKPATEIIIVVMKPISEKTYIDQALKNGHGITYLDDGRIPFKSSDDYKEVVNNYKGGIERATDSKETWKLHDGGWKLGEGIEIPNENKGRFPANLLVQDDVLNNGTIWNKGNNNYDIRGHNDSGSFSRYFDLDIWFENTIKNLPENVQKTFPFLITPKPSKSEKNAGVVDAGVVHYGIERMNTQNKQANKHPTIKPLKLMSWLITIGSRENDTILDPFLGSGTTLCACKLLNRNGIGFELNNEYEPIIKGRLNTTETPKQTKSLFDF